MQTQLIIALFVKSVCFATTPITSLNKVNLRYTPPTTVTNPSPTEGSRDGGTQSGFDTAMRDAADGSMSDTGNLSYVPPWWFTMMSISSGFNNAVRNGIKNGTSDIRIIEDMARNATIEDPDLLHSIQRFHSECFVEARSKYMAMDKTTLSAQSKTLLDPSNIKYGPTDVDWAGSQLFRTEPGFYDTLRAKTPVPGYPVNFARDTNYYNPSSTAFPPAPGEVNPKFGQPYCKEWWEGPDGLRDKMSSHSAFARKLDAAVGSVMAGETADMRKDTLAKLLQSRAQVGFVDQEDVTGTEYTAGTKFARTVGGAVSTFGVAKVAGLAAIEVVPLMTALPMIQALVLMGIYMFLPLAVFFSGFSLRIMFYGAVGIFTVKMWASMWFVAQWLDARLINAMYPGFMGTILMQEITQINSGAIPQGYKRMILNVLLMAMFIGFPMLWTAMMAWASIRLETGISMMSGAKGMAASSASSSVGAARGVGKLYKGKG